MTLVMTDTVEHIQKAPITVMSCMESVESVQKWCMVSSMELNVRNASFGIT